MRAQFCLAHSKKPVSTKLKNCSTPTSSASCEWCQAVLPIMRQQDYGRIINISSVLGFLPAPYMGIYAATKHAIEGYSESLDHEVRRFGIRVSMIEPGFTRTNLNQNS